MSITSDSLLVLLSAEKHHMTEATSIQFGLHINSIECGQYNVYSESHCKHQLLISSVELMYIANLLSSVATLHVQCCLCEVLVVHTPPHH